MQSKRTDKGLKPRSHEELKELKKRPGKMISILRPLEGYHW